MPKRIHWRDIIECAQQRDRALAAMNLYEDALRNVHGLTDTVRTHELLHCQAHAAVQVANWAIMHEKLAKEHQELIEHLPARWGDFCLDCAINESLGV